MTRAEKIEDAVDYLRTGGMGEVIGLTNVAFQMGQEKVQMDTDMAMALALLASEALDAREAATKASWPFASVAPISRQ